MPGMSHEDIDRSHRYHPPRGDQAVRYEEVRRAAREFAHVVKDLTPDSAEQTLALREIESAVMWANKSIAVNEAASNG